MPDEAETLATLGAVVRTLSDENDRLRADNERLQAELDKAHIVLGEHAFKALKTDAELTSLRAAVDAAAKIIDEWDGYDPSYTIADVRAALGATTTPEEPESFEPRVAEQMQRIRATTTQTCRLKAVQKPRGIRIDNLFVVPEYHTPTKPHNRPNSWSRVAR